MTINSTITKAEIAEMPRVVFSEHIEVIDTIEKAEKERKQKRTAEYWVIHASEKKQLETKKRDLTLKLQEIQKEKDSATSPKFEELNALKKQQEKLVYEKKELSIFKSKERQQLQSKIEKVVKEFANKQEILHITQKDFDSKICACNAQITFINNELTKDR